MADSARLRRRPWLSRFGWPYNARPWIGTDGNDLWWRRTLVLPLIGVRSLVVPLRTYRGPSGD